MGVSDLHTLARNKQPIYFATLASKEELVDEYGNRTGQYEPIYNAPQLAHMNIRWDNGEVRLEGFGLNASAKRRIVTDDMNCPIDISTIIWLGISPYETESGTVGYAVVGDGVVGTVYLAKHNYVVSGAPQKSLNHIVYEIEEVNVDRPTVTSGTKSVVK